MFDKLESLLQQWVGVERRELIMNAFAALHAIGHEPAWGEVSQFLEYATDQPLSVIIDTIESILQVGLDCVLSAHAITVDGTIYIKTKVIEALLMLQDYDDPLMIVGLTADSEDSIHTMSNLLELMTGISWVEFIDHLCIVSPTLITMIHDRYTGSAVEALEAVEVAPPDSEQVAALRGWIAKHPNSIVATALSEDMRAIGVPLGVLISDYRLQLAVLEPKAPDSAAMELLGLCLLSDVPIRDLQRGAKDSIELVYTDINFITQVDVALDKYLTEVMRNGQWTSFRTASY